MKARIPNLTPQQKAQILRDVAPQSAPRAIAEPTNPLAGFHTLCAGSPRRLISLWDMIQFYGKEFVQTWEKLDAAITFTHAHQEEKANQEQQQALVELVVEL